MKIIRTQTNIQRHKSTTKTFRKTKNENGISFGREGEKEEREREKIRISLEFFLVSSITCCHVFDSQDDLSRYLCVFRLNSRLS